MKIGVIGLGMVGGAVRHGMNRIGHEVYGFDIKQPGTTLEGALKSDLVFVCVPTPPAKDGTCDASIVERVVSDIAKKKYRGLVTIKSTIEPGTTNRLKKKFPKLRLAFCPEFLRERAMYVDFVENHDVCIIGANSAKDFALVKDAHGSLPKQFAEVTPLEAEFAKYFSNVFNALRIVFANQFYDVCESSGANYQKIKNAITKHRAIPETYLECNQNFRGFGGNCLPKDSLAFARFAAKKLGTNDTIFEHIVEINKRYKPTVF